MTFDISFPETTVDFEVKLLNRTFKSAVTATVPNATVTTDQEVGKSLREEVFAWIRYNYSIVTAWIVIFFERVLDFPTFFVVFQISSKSMLPYISTIGFEFYTF